MDMSWNEIEATSIIDTSIIKPDCFVTISWQQTNSLSIDMATHAPVMHAVTYKYSISKSRHVTFMNKFASWYFLYDQQVGRALVSGEKVGCWYAQSNIIIY